MTEVFLLDCHFYYILFYKCPSLIACVSLGKYGGVGALPLCACRGQRSVSGVCIHWDPPYSLSFLLNLEFTAAGLAGQQTSRIHLSLPPSAGSAEMWVSTPSFSVGAGDPSSGLRDWTTSTLPFPQPSFPQFYISHASYSFLILFWCIIWGWKCFRVPKKRQ